MCVTFSSPTPQSYPFHSFDPSTHRLTLTRGWTHVGLLNRPLHVAYPTTTSEPTKVTYG